MALAVAAAPLALLMTQISTIAKASDPVKALATLSALCFVCCRVWQVVIVNCATHWLAGGGLIAAFRVAESYTEEGVIRLIRRSRWHYTVAYWAGGTSGLGAAFGVIWA